MKEKYWTLIFALIAFPLAIFFSQTKEELAIIGVIIVFCLFSAFKKEI